MLAREAIGEHVWGNAGGSESNVVGVYVGYLRRKIDTPGRVPLLHTIRGVGYMLAAEC